MCVIRAGCPYDEAGGTVGESCVATLGEGDRRRAGVVLAGMSAVSPKSLVEDLVFEGLFGERAVVLFLSKVNVAQILSKYSGTEASGIIPIHSRRTWPSKPSSQFCCYSSFSSSEVEAVLSGGKEEELFKSHVGRTNKS